MVRSNLQYRSSALKPHTKKLKDKLYKMYKKEQHVMSHINFTILKVYLICYIILIGGHYSTEEIYVDCQCYIKLHTVWLLQTKTCIQFHRQQPSHLVLHFQTFSTRTDYYKYQYSFFPHTETLWNSFPHSVVSAASMLTDSAGEYRLMYQICPK